MSNIYPAAQVAVFILLSSAGPASASRQLAAEIEQQNYATIDLKKAVQLQADRVTDAQGASQDQTGKGCDQDTDDRTSDLCAQWKAADSAEESADWAARAFWLGGLGTALLLLTLRYTAKSTRAAADALDMQINSDRPLMQLTKVEYGRFDPFGEHVSFGFGYTVENLGSTGCWIESLDIAVYTNLATTPPEGPTHAFIGAGKGLTTMSEHLRCNFWPEEVLEFLDTPALFCVGSVTYRNAGGIRWKTGFAVRSVIEDGKSKAFNPWPTPHLWFDQRLPRATIKERRWKLSTKSLTSFTR
ncbi:MAG TPA: hypothetical protein VF637_12475 [Sphingomicrobium sp.]|jgi:hypothetical protein